METVPSLITSVKKSSAGKALGLPPKITMARFSRRKDAPMAEIIMEILGASLKGLYAELSNIIPRAPVTIITARKAAYHGTPKMTML